MSEIGFKIFQQLELTDDETRALRRHYLTYARAERNKRRTLHADLDHIYTRIDELAENGELLSCVGALNESHHIVIFATDSSTLALREFQQAMAGEGRLVRLISEDSTDRNGVGALSPNDLLIVVTTSNGFARRQRKTIERSSAYKIVVTASEDPELHNSFDQVLSIGEGAEEGATLHRIYATFGVTYLFDRIFTQYARAFDPELSK